MWSTRWKHPYTYIYFLSGNILFKKKKNHSETQQTVEYRDCQKYFQNLQTVKLVEWKNQCIEFVYVFRSVCVSTGTQEVSEVYGRKSNPQHLMRNNHTHNYLFDQ